PETSQRRRSALLSLSLSLSLSLCCHLRLSTATIVPVFLHFIQSYQRYHKLLFDFGAFDHH
ncbi:hypothetical protein, partial [Salmonella enterica]|uniref:hypothetical protein n=1 Tax=Salmonella enterica TaxID=28901 RepID=UPI003524EEC3